MVLKKCSPQLRTVVGDVELESALHVKELQTTLVCLTLLSKKYKVRSMWKMAWLLEAIEWQSRPAEPCMADTPTHAIQRAPSAMVAAAADAADAALHSTVQWSAAAVA